MHSQTGNQPRKQHKDDSVAQLVEQMTLNHWVVGSSPTGVTRQNIKMQKTSEIQPISEVFRYPPTGVSTQNIEAAGWPKRVHYRKRRGLYPCEGSERYRSTVYTDSKPIKS